MNGRDKREDWGRTSGESGFQASISEWRQAWKSGRWVLGWLTGIYGVLALVGMVALEYWGERLWVFSLLLFAPPLVILLPLVGLMVMSLVMRPRLLLYQLGVVLFLVFWYMNFEWTKAVAKGDGQLTAVTFNVGQSNRPQFEAFLEAEQPDVILLQDTTKTYATLLGKKMRGSVVVAEGEFAMVSRFPVRETKLLAEPLWAGRPVGMRFEVMVNDRPLVFYSIHMPTPRRELSRFIGFRGILRDFVGRPHREPGFGNYREWMAKRVELATTVRKILAEEKSPCIVGGDFNMPDHGLIYHLFASELSDAFKVAGCGWGLTFPGSTRNPLAGFGPWLRLDYFFTGRGWRAVECRPEAGTKSQHKAVMARFQPIQENGE
jgi:vancomycin resistance protein VanJ